MIPRLVGVFHAGLLSIAFSTNAFAALATADVLFDWTTFDFATTGDLAVTMTAPMGDDGGTCADGAPCDSGATTSFGGLDLSSIGLSSSASLVTTPDLIDASASTSLGFGSATFERFFSFEALSGSGTLSLSVDVEITGAVQGAGTVSNSEALFGYEVGSSGVVGSFASLEMYGDSGDDSQTLSTILAFSVSMGQGDTIAMFAEGEAAAESVVPVPAAVWLFGSGLLGMIGIARGMQAG
jgi:hypothetical protein